MFGFAFCKRSGDRGDDLAELLLDLREFGQAARLGRR
jgi:hypothetical protein